jgi:hypothetical protein
VCVCVCVCVCMGAAGGRTCVACLLALLRVQVLFDVQAGSIKAGSERSLFSGTVEVSGVTRRYAALAASCLTLMADHDSDDSEWQGWCVCPHLVQACC